MDDVRLIDANTVMSKLKAEVDNIPKRTNYPIGIADGISYAMASIDCAPTVDAQPVKHGMWERTDMFVKCSECGVELLDDSFFGIHVFDDGYMPFCPNCGRRMTY